MDAPDLDIWIQAQNPPILQEIMAVDSGNPLPVLKSDGAVSGGDAEDLKSGQMRDRAIRTTAFSYGAQAGLAWRYERLLAFTKSQEGSLDRIANFAPFIADERMLLPSITESRDRFDVGVDGREIREVEIQYVIDEPPRAISQPPTWRDYLWRDFQYPDPPHRALLPRDSRETAIWKESVQEGWESGIEQAQFSWEDNLARLVRDVRGRITYRILEARGIVNKPVMSKGVPELTQSEDGTILNAGDTVYSITVPMTFSSPDNWGALWSKASKGEPLLQPDEAVTDRYGSFNVQPVFSPDQ